MSASRTLLALSLWTAALWLAPAGPAAAESLDAIFAKANAAYFQDDLGGAIEGYERLLEAGVQDPDVYFNLATAHGRRSELGHAILYFERALWLRPGDDGAEAGLSAARRVLGKQRAEREGEATVRTRPPITQALARPLSAQTLAWLVLLLDALVFGLLIARPHIAGETARLAATVAIPLVGVAALTLGGLLAVKLDVFETGEAAVVLTDGAGLHEGPDARAKVRAKARQGERARVLGSEFGYLRVRLPGAQGGWMKRSDIARIRPD